MTTTGNKRHRFAAAGSTVHDDDDESTGASDGASDGGCDYGSSGEEYYFNDDCEDDGEETDGVANVDDYGKKKNNHIVVLTVGDVRRRQEEVISKVAEVLSFPPGFAAALLRHSKWDASRVEEQWFSDDRRVRAAVGMSPDGVPVPTSLSAAASTCAICFADYPAGETRSASCGAHFYCGECWVGYISAALDEGSRCLSLRCPEASCHAAVVRELVDAVAGADDRARYARFALRSFVEEGSGLIKWCPAPGCTLAVEFTGDGADATAAAMDVFCACRHGFCFRCGEEAHRPVSCDTVRAWLEKNNSSSETANWVLINTKLCPKCKRPIEKNQGCMHMTCRPPCGHQFCWVCLGPWPHQHCQAFREHDDGSRRLHEADEAEQRRRHAQESLDRYLYHYERWVANHTSLEKVRQDIDELEISEFGRIAAMVGLEENSLEFLMSAYEQIADGRRVLKWAYAYGYYLDPARDAAKRALFEDLLDQANSRLDHLHDAAELERREIFCHDAEPGVVLDLMGYYQTRVENHTQATRQFMGNLVKAFEKADLPELKSLN